MTYNRNIFLLIRQFLTGSNPNLLFDQIDSCHPFCDGMFHLNSSIHFHKIEICPILHKKLYGSCIDIFIRNCCFYCFCSHLVPKLLRDCRTWSLFDKFLMVSLNGAVPFPQVNDIPVGIRQNLNFHMARVLDKMFHIYRIVSECSFRLCSCGQICVLNLLF